jgi:hypothetical protein
MRLREQPELLSQLSADLRAKIEADVCSDLAGRIRTGTVVYLLVLVIVWTSTDYFHDHRVLFGAFSVFFILGSAIRLLVVSFREKIWNRSPDLWYRGPL